MGKLNDVIIDYRATYATEQHRKVDAYELKWLNSDQLIWTDELQNNLYNFVAQTERELLDLEEISTREETFTAPQ